MSRLADAIFLGPVRNIFRKMGQGLSTPSGNPELIQCASCPCACRKKKRQHICVSLVIRIFLGRLQFAREQRAGPEFRGSFGPDPEWRARLRVEYLAGAFLEQREGGESEEG